MKYDTVIYGMLPRKYREAIEKESKYAGQEATKESFTATLFIIFFSIAMANFLYLAIFIRAPIYLTIIPPIVVLIAGFAGPYIVYTLVAESRRKYMEQLLPDLLLLTASNIKSGLTIDKALLFSARPEFGELGQEFKKVAFEIYGGKPIEDSFRTLTEKIKSFILERTIGLLVEGLRSGGAVAKLLEETAQDIRNTEMLQKEINSSVMMYIMFIFMAAVLGAPILFAISGFLVSSTTSMWDDMGEVDSEFAQAGLITMQKPDIDLDLFKNFCLGALVITTFFAGLLISLIQSGNLKGGIKYVPFFMSIAIALYYAAQKILMLALGDMFG